MSGHGGFSAIGSGMKVPQTFDMPKVEELQPGKDGGPLGERALPVSQLVQFAEAPFVGFCNLLLTTA